MTSAFRDELRASARLFLTLLVVVYLSLSFFKFAGYVAAIWPANAILLVALLAAPQQRFKSRLLAGSLGSAAAYLAASEGWPDAIGLSALNAAAVAFGYIVMTRTLKTAVDLTRPRHLVYFLAICAVAAPAISSLLAAAFLSVYQGAPFFETAVSRLIAHALGMIIFAPALLILVNQGVGQRLSRQMLLNAAALFSLLLAVLSLVSLQSSFPLLYLVPPMLTLITFRLGLAGGAWAVLITAVFSIAALQAGHGPVTLVGQDPSVRVYTLQLFLAFMALTTLPLASILGVRRDFERLILAERQIAEDTAARLGETSAVATMAETMAGVGHWVYRPESGEEAWSTEMYRIFGFAAEGGPRRLDELIPRLHPDDREVALTHFQRLSASGEPYELSLRIIDGDEVRPVLFSARAIVGLDGAPSSLLGIIIDKTRLTQIEEALIESETRYRELAALFPDLVIRFARDWRITYASPASRRYGYEPDDMVGLLARDLIHPDDLAAAEARHLESFAAHSIDPNLRGEQRVRAANGGWIWMEGNPVQVKDREGKVQEVINVFRDVTRRRELEDDLQAALLTAEQALRIKGDFLSNMSHELRTPLTAVLGFSGLIESQPELSPMTRRFADRVANAGKALLATVNDILDFSKLEAGQVEIQTGPFNPQVVLADAFDLFSVQAHEKGIDLTAVGLDQLPPTLALAADRVRQVLLNLLGNAVKFTDAGQVILEASYDRPRSTLRVSVTDTGAGIPAERLDKLFKRFSQVDGSSTRKHGGTGLGLAICKGLVDAMGGQIGVSSEEGQGSRFWFELPAPELDQPIAADGHALTHALPEGCRVLVVDDNLVNRDLVSTVLRVFGAEITEAKDGEEAVSMAATEPFDVILMDLRMPGMGGEAATRTIRTGGGPNSEIPIIAFSADVIYDFSGSLFDGLVVKPLDAALLIAGISKALNPDSEAIDAA